MHVTLLGAGRLGRSLALLLPRAGHRATVCRRHEPVPEDSDVVLLTVPDAAIGLAVRAVPDKLPVLHCSGATDLAPLAHRLGHGSLHPLMTFPGPEHGLPDLTGVPAAVDGDEVGVHLATALARDLGLKPVRVPGDRRLYHAAAVLAGNGATLLLAEACRALHAAGVDADVAAAMLVPLAARSVANAVPDPLATLTGPIARGDRDVLRGHREALREAGLPEVAELHRLLDQLGTAGLTARVPARSSGPSETPE